MDTPTQTAKPSVSRTAGERKSEPEKPERSMAGAESPSLPRHEPVKRSLIRQYRESDAWLWTEVAAVVLGLAIILPTGFALWSDLKDRKTQRNAQAWESVTRTAPGNSGKGPALEYLNSQLIPLVGINLSADKNDGASYLVDVNLQNAILESAKFSGANLKSANFTGANLRKADLSGVNLERATLSMANLKFAKLPKSNLLEADLSLANLWSADVSQSNLSEANLYKANFRKANLSEAYLWQADLTKATLSETNLSKAILRNTNLSKADLSNANLSEATLWYADLSDVNLSGADLSGAFLEQAKNLTQEILDTACGDDKTALPTGLSIESCSKN